MKTDISSEQLCFLDYELESTFRWLRVCGECGYLYNDTSWMKISHLESETSDIIWNKINIKSTIKFTCCINRSSHDKSFYEVFVHFKIHNSEWMGSTSIDQQVRAAEMFTGSDVLTNISFSRTHSFQGLNTNPNPLDLILPTNPDPIKTQC